VKFVDLEWDLVRGKPETKAFGWHEKGKRKEL
jgi:hypothetical protein